ncbi:hypothetical protein G4V62_04305 [Bacillaceae bacterium SIJ1]|uniref:hypothetical protein n=1 Tax=Litoribacterium kuwaitense TaxID=1398745 RepID=UPI0013E9C013|nr:hypothetical protein [Litoribacterium kuwaitense]NGP44208.1 hypothetical protein [Litoribacterium kuwaitense]
MKRLNKSFHFSGWVIILLLIVTSCGVSENEALQTLKNVVQDAKEMTPPQPNETTKPLTFYKPETFEITEEDEYNVILEEQGHLFILYSNPLGDEQKQPEHANEFFSDTLSFAENEGSAQIKIIVTKEDEESYLITVEKGPIKMTNRTDDRSHLSRNAQYMLEIMASASPSSKEKSS